jgi:plastocyanin
MNRYARSLTAIALLGLLAACAPAADDGASASPHATVIAPATEQPMPSMSMAAEPSDDASAAASHDMGDMGGSTETANVEIANFAYAQANLTISAGTEVTFTNLDSAPHTVTAGTDEEPMPDLFDSGLLQQGESFTFVFEEPGEYVYFCDRHPPMQGTVTVSS